MNNRKMFILIITLACMYFFSFSITSFGNTYPDKEVTLIVPWSPGGGSDTSARMLADGLKKIFGVPFIIQNKPGAGGEIGILALINSKPDGYTIGVGINVPSSLAIPLAKPKGAKTYTMNDFTRIANLDLDSSILMVNTNSPFKTLDDFIKYAKENPNKITIAHTGPGGDDYLAAKLIEREADIKLEGVQYDSSSGQLADLAGGHVDSAAVNVSQVSTLIKAGKIRALAVMDEERASILPEVPTFKEKGLDVIMYTARGVSGPAGISNEIVSTLSNAIKKVILEDPDFLERAKKRGLLTKFIGSQEYEKFMEEEYKKLEKLWEEGSWL